MENIHKYVGGMMFKFFKPFIPKAILAALFKMGEAFCDLSLPLIMAKIIDIGVSNKDLTYITKMGGTMVGIALIGYICSIFCNYFSVHSTQAPYGSTSATRGYSRAW